MLNSILFWFGILVLFGLVMVWGIIYGKALFDIAFFGTIISTVLWATLLWNGCNGGSGESNTTSATLGIISSSVACAILCLYRPMYPHRRLRWV